MARSGRWLATGSGLTMELRPKRSQTRSTNKARWRRHRGCPGRCRSAAPQRRALFDREPDHIETVTGIEAFAERGERSRKSLAMRSDARSGRDSADAKRVTAPSTRKRSRRRPSAPPPAALQLLHELPSQQQHKRLDVAPSARSDRRDRRSAESAGTGRRGDMAPRPGRAPGRAVAGVPAEAAG